MKNNLLFVAMAAMSFGVSAHHGSNAQFNLAVDLEVTGVVTELKFVNPHSYVYLDVTNDAGEIEPWRCEMRSSGFLRQRGWTEEMFSEGTVLHIKGAPARREEFGCYVASLSFEDGRVLDRHGDGAPEQIIDEALQAADVQIAEGTPNFSGNWTWINARVSPDRAVAAGLPAAGPRSSYSPTEMGEAAVVGLGREDSPRFHCQITNIFHDWLFNEHVNSVEQTDEKIVLNYGFMGLVRTIHLDIDAHPENLIPSRSGHSIGWWEGETLVVDTIGFLPGVLNSIGTFVKHSDAMHALEQFTLGENSRTLNIDYRITDPLYLSEPYAARSTVAKTMAPFESYDCEELTEEVVPGF